MIIDVTNEFLAFHRNDFFNNNLTNIKFSILKNNYVITHLSNTPATKASTIKSKTFNTYYLRADKSGKYTKEWRTSLYCKFSYNPDTGNITKISNPVLNVTFSGWGTAFDSSYYNGSLGYTISVKYSCSYKVKASFKLFPYILADTLDYGSCSNSYILSV